jgi:hypothetical protein
MTNFELERFMRDTACAPRRFRVVGADQLPTSKPLEGGQVIICNTQPSTQNGEHWVLFHVANATCKGTTVNYFDPLGECSLEYPNFRAFVSNYNLLVSNRGLPVQHNGRGGLFSETCGLHCMYVAHLLCDKSEKYRSLKEVMRMYDLNNSVNAVNFNECVVLYYMCNRYGKNMCSEWKKLTGCSYSTTTDKSVKTEKKLKITKTQKN